MNQRVTKLLPSIFQPNKQGHIVVKKIEKNDQIFSSTMWNEFQFPLLLLQNTNRKRKNADKKEKWVTRRVLEGSVAEERDDERQSATARRKGSGNFLMEEDLNRETPINCGVKLEDIGFDSIRVGLTRINDYK